MASAPTNLPLFYKDLMPLNSRDHSTWSYRMMTSAPWLAGQHAVPVTVEEFPIAQRHFPIIFSTGERPVPLALMGLNEGVNVFVNDEGIVEPGVYIPAYIRRYPFLLARLEPGSDAMSLCFDPESGAFGEFEDGEKLFDGEEPSAFTQELLKFSESFEEAGHRTQAFVEELVKHGLLMEGEVAITQEGAEQPFVYRGFQMVNAEKLHEVRGDQLRTWNQNGLLGLVFAHLFSLDQMHILFGRQTHLGKGPGIQAVPATAPAEAPAPAPSKKTKK